MTQKIFELAKELDVKPLDLVEELKSKGFNVRNHMSSLSADDVAKFNELKAAEAAKAEEADAGKKKTKRKTTKKKTATKKKTTKKKVAKTTKKTSKVEAKSETDTDDTDAAKTTKKTTVRRKAVIRKKSGEADEVETESTTSLGAALGADPAPESTESDELSIEAQSNVDTDVATEDRVSSEATVGLRVISKPEPAKAAPSEAKPESKEETELYKEKSHKFTPVYIPPKKEASEESDSKPKSESSEDDSKDAKTDKKRFGGLAAMMSKPKAAHKSRNLTQMRADEEMKSYAALSSLGKPIYTPVGRKKVYAGPTSQTEITETKDSKRVVHMHNSITGKDLAQKLSVKFKDMVNECLQLNLLVKEDDHIGEKLAANISSLFGYRVENKAFDEDKTLGKDEEKDTSNLPSRNPIITIMGHVDHGKTTLLDFIRNSKVVDGEAGGITQHIGAYSVQTKDKKTLTFLDTPGHAAFASMRQRGADVTDIVVLVVAADDGVMPQTKESVRFCEQAGVPIIVAVNKIDKEGCNPDRVKQELVELNITPEEWGGDTQFVHISALKGTGVDDLLESIALQAEMLELKADPKGKAEGVVIEAKVEQGRGPIATVLVQKGTLKKGDSVVVGETFGRARSLMDQHGKQLKSAGPSTPVQILGINDPAQPGDIFNVAKSEREAKKIVDNRIDQRKKLESTPATKVASLEDFFSSREGEDTKVLKLIVRADVQGSYEAIKQSLETVGNSEVYAEVIGGGVGAINDNDVLMASSANGYIIGFNMRPITSARRLAEEKGVDVKTYSIIYELINDVKMALEGLLEPEYTEKYIGRAEVRDTFSIPKIGLIAGSAVIDGKIARGCNIRLLRDGKIVFDGKMSSLKRFKDDAKEVSSGYECGIGLEDFNDVKVNDIFEAYILEETKRKLESSDATL